MFWHWIHFYLISTPSSNIMLQAKELIKFKLSKIGNKAYVMTCYLPVGLIILINLESDWKVHKYQTRNSEYRKIKVYITSLFLYELYNEVIKDHHFSVFVPNQQSVFLHTKVSIFIHFLPNLRLFRFDMRSRY